MLSHKKKTGIGLVLCGVALLILAFIGIPMGFASVVRLALVLVGVALVLAALPLMWADGIRNLRSWPKINHLHRMRQSGFFDIAMLFAVLALILLALGVFGMVSYNATFARHAKLAAGDGPVPATLEEARLLPGFVEYSFDMELRPGLKVYRSYR